MTKWTDNELLFALYIYLEKKTGNFNNKNDNNNLLTIMNYRSGNNRTVGSFTTRLSNYQYLDTGKGLSHSGRARQIWDNYAKNETLLTEIFSDFIRYYAEKTKTNEKFYEVQKYLSLKNPSLTENEIELYETLLNALSEVVDSKISYIELLKLYDELTDDIPFIENNDRISIPYFSIDKKYGKTLNQEEMLDLSFACFYGACVQFEDEKGTIKNGFVALKNGETIKQLRKLFMKKTQHSDKFGFMHIKTSS